MRHPNILDGQNIFEPEKIKNLVFYYQELEENKVNL